jgi:DNA polymerase delta subunit 2
VLELLNDLPSSDDDLDFFQQYLPPQPASEKYADPEKDEFFLEDESGRVRLVGDSVAPDGFLRSSLITGELQ